MKVEFKYANGIEVRCVVSGLTGIIDCAALWLNGCKRYSVQPQIKKGEVVKPDSIWIDEEQLAVIGRGVLDVVTPTPTGGPSMVNKSRG